MEWENIFKVGDKVGYLGNYCIPGKVISVKGNDVTVKWPDGLEQTVSYTVLSMIEPVERSAG